MMITYNELYVLVPVSVVLTHLCQISGEFQQNNVCSHFECRLTKHSLFLFFVVSKHTKIIYIYIYFFFKAENCMIYMQELNNLFSVDHLLLIIIDLIVHIDPNIILYTGLFKCCVKNAQNV